MHIPDLTTYWNHNIHAHIFQRTYDRISIASTHALTAWFSIFAPVSQTNILIRRDIRANIFQGLSLSFYNRDNNTLEISSRTPNIAFYLIIGIQIVDNIASMHVIVSFHHSNHFPWTNVGEMSSMKRGIRLHRSNSAIDIPLISDLRNIARWVSLDTQ